MDYDLAIFAGGLGSRLRNTEKMPKPLVNINGLSLLSRIILSFNKTGIFNHFHILTCFESNIFENILNKEIPFIKYSIYEEGQRTGRVGALKNFFDQKINTNQLFVCNGDTYFISLKEEEILRPLNKPISKPVVYLAACDDNRDDYKVVYIKNELDKKKLQNSGLFLITKNIFIKYVQSYPLLKDIDDYLFLKDESSEFSLLSTTVLDGGTPDRLQYMRDVLI